MRARLLALLLAPALLLTSCAGLLDREFSEVTPHNAAPTAEGDPSILRAESYQELVNALLYFVTTGAETGTVRLYVDSEEVDGDLEAACLEVVQEDPLGAYAVEFIKYSVTPVVTYHEADLQITYRRSREQVAAIASVTGATAIRTELEEALTSFDPEVTLRVSYFDGDEDYIRRLCREAYLASPGSALDMPEITVSLYPDSGQQRVVEILLRYDLEREELERRRDALEDAAENWALELENQGLEGDELLLAAARLVRDLSADAENAGSTAYSALLGGGADSQGLAMAMTLLCQTLEVPCVTVDGTLGGEAHLWNAVRTTEGWRHLDLSALDAPEEGSPFRTDAQLTEAGALWNTDTTPHCGP